MNRAAAAVGVFCLIMASFVALGLVAEFIASVVRGHFSPWWFWLAGTLADGVLSNRRPRSVARSAGSRDRFEATIPSLCAKVSRSEHLGRVCVLPARGSAYPSPAPRGTLYGTGISAAPASIRAPRVPADF